MKKTNEVSFAEAVECVKSGDMIPYIKPTRRVHDSGFRIFEVGYCDAGGDSRVSRKCILGECTDHVQLGNRGDDLMLNMDLTRDGHIRIWSWHRSIVLFWNSPSSPYALSSMELTPSPYGKNNSSH